jgi:hypothetical protein
VRITLTKNQVLHYSDLYAYDGDDVLRRKLGRAVQRDYITREDLIDVARWKWKGGRTWRLVAGNSESEVQEASAVAFATKCERLRVGALLALRGVQWPMASVILHFAFPERYPILDARAMNTVGGSKVYNFDRWMEYVALCREASQRFEVTMRVLDRALWTYDKEHVQNARSEIL